MEHDGRPPGSRWRLPRVFGAAALTAGLFALALPVGPALASTARASTGTASPAATAPPTYSLEFVTSAKAVGHTWAIDFSFDGTAVNVGVATVYGSGSTAEDHSWTTTSAFTSAGIKDLKVTRTGHATFNTGKALNPVLAANVAFTPVKAVKEACAHGSGIGYAGRVSGTLSLVTGLRGVKFALKFTGKTAAELGADKSCVPPVPPVKAICTGGNWLIGGGSTPFTTDGISGQQILGSKPKWQDTIAVSGIKTASKLVTRGLLLSANGPAPTVNTAKKTFSVAGSGAITGAAVVGYNQSFTPPAQLCSFNGKQYKETTTGYFGQTIKVTKAFQGHTVLAGQVSMKTGIIAIYSAVKLSAP
jgi:hypothetical protein